METFTLYIGNPKGQKQISDLNTDVLLSMQIKEGLFQYTEAIRLETYRLNCG